MQLQDQFGRHINYLRLSVTDRCDFRCVYCMSEDMTFLPRAQLLTLEEMAELAQTFAELGVKKIRITGGEPLIRRNVIQLFNKLGSIDSLEEVTVTTNGSQLSQPSAAGYSNVASELKAAGVKRLNISLDTLDPAQFKELTRTGDLDRVLDGIEAARSAGFERIKLNAVIMKQRNDHQVLPLVDFALERGLDISFIEEMPLGQITEHGRREQLCSSEEIRTQISRRFSLIPSSDNSGGPSKYWRIEKPSGGQQDSRIGFISPHSENFCSSCNRVRVTAEGQLLLCLGNEHSVDLKSVMRSHPGDRARLKQTIVDAMTIKPERHHFFDGNAEQIVRFMNATGG